METKYKIDKNDRDPTTGKLLHPYVHAALKYLRHWVRVLYIIHPIFFFQMIYSLSPFRFQVEDPRTSAPGVYGNCAPSDTRIFGHGAQYAADGQTLADRGLINGSLVVELNDSGTHMITSMVFAILAREVVSVVTILLQLC